MRRQWPARVLPLTLALSMGMPAVAHADDAALTRAQEQIDEANSRFEQASKDYQAAKDAVSELESQIVQNEENQARIEGELPAQRERTAASIKTLYKFQQSTRDLLDIVLTSDDFDDLVATAHYLDSILDRNVAEVNALANMENELTQTKTELTAQRDAAEQKRIEADEALQGASTALQDARANKRELEAAREREKAAEEARRTTVTTVPTTQPAPSPQQDRQPAQEPVTDVTSQSNDQQPAQEAPSGQDQPSTAEQPASEQPSTDTTLPEPTPEPAPESEPTPQPEPTTPEPAPAEVVPAASGEVADWAARIDAYLAGSPLAGYGAVFAQAAADYGVDPRISPAISCIESGKGSVCFLPHNAWGWGTASWPDWESAIRGHVSGFSSIYGSTLTLSGAQMYASNDIYDYWYSLVQSEMASI